MFTYTFPQMKMLKFNYMSTKQFPIALTCAHFWYQRSETSSHGSDSLSPTEQEESGLWLVLGPAQGLQPQASSVFKATYESTQVKNRFSKGYCSVKQLKMTWPQRDGDLH